MADITSDPPQAAAPGAAVNGPVIAVPERTDTLSESGFDLSKNSARANWVRLRTLVLLRWVAVVGQLSALTVAQRLYDFQIEIAL